jgi:hypothetical protein
MKKPRNKKEAEQLVDWMRNGLPENSALPAALTQDHERLVRAYEWMNVYMSIPIVAPMLAQEYNYSIDTARRDIQEAQRRFGEFESHPKSFYAKMMVDKIGECLHEAILDRKWREVSGLSRELREWVNASEAASVKDPNQLLTEVPRILVFTPQQLGHERNPNILEEARLLIEEKTGKAFEMPSFPETPADLIPTSDEEPAEE